MSQIKCARDSRPDIIRKLAALKISFKSGEVSVWETVFIEVTEKTLSFT